MPLRRESSLWAGTWR